MLWVLPILFALVVIAAFVQLVVADLVTSPGDLIQITYRAADSFRLDDTNSQVRWFFVLWATLTLGRVCHPFHSSRAAFFQRPPIPRHLQRIARPARRKSDPAASADDQAANLFWLAGGAVMAGCIGAWWAVPMVIGGALQRRDAFAMHRDLRWQLADRVNALSIAHSLPELRCQTPRCQAVLKPGSRFCPRCGSAVSPLSNTRGILA